MPASTSYTPSRLHQSFHIAGFQYWDGASVLSELAAGRKLELRAEPDNPADEEAVAIFHDGTKLGYVPSELNGVVSQLLYFGHTDVFEAVVQQVAPERSPWHQVRVGIFVKDAR